MKKELIKISNKLYRTKSCSYCDNPEATIKNVTTKRKNGDTVIYMSCRDCQNKRTKLYYKNNKEKFREIIYRSIKKHQHKQDCRMKSRYLLRVGELVKPEVCVVCKENVKVEMHHEDYKKPHLVLWICRGCHANLHHK